MGWLFSPQWRTKEDMVNHILYDIRNCGVIDHSVKGSELWVLHTSSKDNSVRLCVFVICKQDNEFGYKDAMDVNSHPYYYQAPKKFVLKATFDNESAKEWLKKWEYKHSKEAKEQKELWKQLKFNDKFMRVIGGNHEEEVTFLREYSTQSVVYKTVNGQMFRCKKSQVKLIEVKELVEA